MPLVPEKELWWLRHKAAMLDALMHHQPIPHPTACGAVDACTCLGAWVEGIQRAYEEERIRIAASDCPPGMAAALWDAWQRRNERPLRAWNAYLDREEAGR